MSIALKTTEYSAWVHSLNFVDDTTNINTWVDWHLVPMSRPLVNAPKMKTCIVDIPGADGQIDLSTVVSGKPVYSNRTGNWEFMVQNGWNPNKSFTNATDINNVIGGTVISPGKVFTITGIDANADCALKIYIRDNKLRVQTVNLVTGETSESYSLRSMTSNTDTVTVTGIKFESNASGDTRHVIVSCVLTYASGSQYSEGISQQVGNVHGNSYGTVLAVTSDYDTASWSTMFSLIMNTLNGKTMKVLLDNESVLNSKTNTYSPSWYYEGLITIDNWKTGDKYSTITIAYDLKPYKYSYDDPTIKSL